MDKSYNYITRLSLNGSFAISHTLTGTQNIPTSRGLVYSHFIGKETEMEIRQLGENHIARCLWNWCLNLVVLTLVALPEGRSFSTKWMNLELEFFTYKIQLKQKKIFFKQRHQLGFLPTGKINQLWLPSMQKDVNGSGSMGDWKGSFGNAKGSENWFAGSKKYNNSLQKESGQITVGDSTCSDSTATNGHENPFKHFLYAYITTSKIKSQETMSDWLSSSHTSNSWLSQKAGRRGDMLSFPTPSPIFVAGQWYMGSPHPTEEE